MVRTFCGPFFYCLLLAMLVLMPGISASEIPAAIPDGQGKVSEQYSDTLMSNPIVTPLCPAGTPFGAERYAQNTLQSDPMVFECSWDGTGKVYLSGDRNSLAGTYADDGFTVTIEPAKDTFHSSTDGPSHHPVIELTKGMTPGKNSFTLVVKNNGLSLWYGLFPAGSVSQTPYIIQVTDTLPTAPMTGTPASEKTPLNPENIGSVNGDSRVAWTMLTPDAGWAARYGHAVAAMPDGSIILMGGAVSHQKNKNDTWISTDNGASWMLINASSGWGARKMHTTLVTPDGTILLIGGSTGPAGENGCMNDVWQSQDHGRTWTQVNGNAGWSPRESMAGVVLHDGRVIVAGGTLPGGYTQFNDVWRSDDKGVTWTEITPHAGWEARYGQGMATLTDGTIVLTGGYTFGHAFWNDVWQSIDKGASWTRLNKSAAWPGRMLHTSVVMPDNSIIIMGGRHSETYLNDLWMSADGGATWTPLKAESRWTGREYFTGTLMPDGSIVLIGGFKGSTLFNDVWQFRPSDTVSRSPFGTLIITKTVSPSSLKKGTDAKITITVHNQGNTPVHDVEILDVTLPQLPVIDGSPQYSAPAIGPDDTRILTYQVHATKAGTYRLNRTTVMYADIDGNYHYAYSNYENVNVLASLLQPGQQQKETGFIQDLTRAINEFISAQ